MSRGKNRAESSKRRRNSGKKAKNTGKQQKTDGFPGKVADEFAIASWSAVAPYRLRPADHNERGGEGETISDFAFTFSQQERAVASAAAKIVASATDETNRAKAFF